MERDTHLAYLDEIDPLELLWEYQRWKALANQHHLIEGAYACQHGFIRAIRRNWNRHILIIDKDVDRELVTLTPCSHVILSELRHRRDQEINEPPNLA